MKIEVHNLVSSIRSLSDEFGYDLYEIDFDLEYMINIETNEFVDLTFVGGSVPEVKKHYRKFIAFHNSMSPKDDQICWVNCC